MPGDFPRHWLTLYTKSMKKILFFLGAYYCIGLVLVLIFPDSQAKQLTDIWDGSLSSLLIFCAAVIYEYIILPLFWPSHAFILFFG